MDQWRPRAPIQGTPCPTCSISHFPFCPPHLQNPNFPPDSFQRPNFDPYSRPIAPPPPPPWLRNPNLAYQGFAPPPPPPSQPQPPPPPPPYDYSGNGYVNDGDRSFKRPRIDDFGSGPGFRSEFDPNSSGGYLSEDERRLKLIHDHGGSNQGFDGSVKHSVSNNVQSNGSYAVNYEPQHSHLQNHSNQLPQGYGMQRQGGYFQPRTPALRPISGQQPPLPVSPPPPLPSKGPPTLFPVHNVSSPMTSAAYQPNHEAHHSMPPPYFHSKPFSHASTGYVMEFPKEAHVFHQTLPKQYVGDGQPFPQKRSSLDKPKVVDALHLFKQPHRVTRPDHFVVILRGLPGSGKSYLAKLLRDLEVENGGGAPRIHSMDDYFMTEVEKVEESDASKSSSSSRGKKPVVKKVMEYCYEPEMQEAYRSSMLKAFKKTLEDDVFTFVIVDDRNLRVAEFAQFWAIAKSSGYEVYILEAPYKDPAGCAARNVHGFTQEDIQKMAEQWEESPSIYLQLDAKSLFHGDDLKESGIQEVDMDTEDVDNDVISGAQERKPEKTMKPPAEDNAPDGSSKDVKSLDAEEDHPGVEVKELGRSKWSEILDEDDTDKTEEVKSNALSGLIQAYRKEVKSVCWSDQVGNTGFSITAAKKANVSSLVIGPGAGYNLRSNPLPEEENPVPPRSTAKPKRQNVFQDQLRAEHESFKAVFDRRRHRIGGLDLEDE
uniref:YLP motif-containing protein 1 isoform X2 n=1 Tax=Fragaria vesca subsp. vesca TaxID=101020 RepID=UPI0005CAE2FD|nr:PREDICTED: YLP motif-containing protein 1 isoform X2 [Fragaria vesca subsp. vesca]